MNRLLTSTRSKLGALAAVAVLAFSVTAATSSNAASTSFRFALKPSSAAISSCLPHAGGSFSARPNPRLRLSTTDVRAMLGSPDVQLIDPGYTGAELLVVWAV